MLMVKLINGKTEELSLDRLAKSIDKAFTKAKVPHSSYISQMIAKAAIDRLENKYSEIPITSLTISTYNTLCDLGYEEIATIYSILVQLNIKK